MVRGEKCGQQGEVGHGAGAVLGVDPALYGFPFVRVSVCEKIQHDLKRRTPRTQAPPQEKGGSLLTCSHGWIPHKLSGDGTQELIRNAGAIRLVLQLLHFPQEFAAQAQGLCRRVQQ